MQAKMGIPKQLRCGWAKGGGREGRDERAGLRWRRRLEQDGGWGSRDTCNISGYGESLQALLQPVPPAIQDVQQDWGWGGISACQSGIPLTPIISCVAPKLLTLSSWHSASLSQLPNSV